MYILPTSISTSRNTVVAAFSVRRGCLRGSACVEVVTVQYSKKGGRHYAMNVDNGLGVVVAGGIV